MGMFVEFISLSFEWLFHDLAYAFVWLWLGVFFSKYVRERMRKARRDRVAYLAREVDRLCKQNNVPVNRRVELLNYIERECDGKF